MSDPVTRQILRSGPVASADLQVLEIGYGTDINRLLIGTGNPETIISIPTDKSTGDFAYDENLNFTQIKISGGGINGTPIGSDIPAVGNFSNVVLEWYEDGEQSESNDPIIQFRSMSVDQDNNINENISSTTYGFIERVNADDGGIRINGLTSAVTAIDITGWADTSGVDEAKTAGGSAVVEMTAGGTVSGDRGALTGNANAFGWYVSTEAGKNAVAFLTADGDLVTDGSVTDAQVFDDFDDVKLVSGLRGMMMQNPVEDDVLRAKFAEWIAYAREPMIRHGIITVCPDTGKVFLNMKRAMFLMFDAMRQISDRVAVLEANAVPTK